jgi:hypothetical protein
MLPAFVISSPVIPVIQIALKLPAILGDFLAIALDVTAIAPISIIRKQAACYLCQSRVPAKRSSRFHDQG